MLVVDTRGVVRGKLKAAGTMCLDCWLEGDVTCSRLEIGRDGYILGTVTARELIVEGQIVGNVEASVVHLMEGAFVEGDIRHSVISIHAGATLLGRAVRTRGFAPTELVELEVKAAADPRALEGECRANAKIAGADWQRYQIRRGPAAKPPTPGSPARSA
jgi:cytoskeletal protein CcmA (bactofilin family)